MQRGEKLSHLFTIVLKMLISGHLTYLMVTSVLLLLPLAESNLNKEVIETHTFDLVPNGEYRTFSKGILPEVVQPGEDGELECSFTYRPVQVNDTGADTKESWSMTLVHAADSGYFECTVQVEDGQTSKVKLDFFRIFVRGKKISKTTALRTNEEPLAPHQYREYHKRSFVLSDTSRFHGQLSFLSVECGEGRTFVPRTEL
ncbi:uncharacterized protein LOC135483827 [Lineus longissimus]|uniref:uncharacterized protein LOC135483827 n=1 Tax=Lineus longissimus TaxID=88925 RepID=UPI002B4DC873